MQEYGREQQSFVDQVITPLAPIIAAVVLILLILAIVLAYRRFMPKRWPPRLRRGRINSNLSPMIVIDSVIADQNPRLHRIVPLELTPVNPSRQPGENTVHVEIVNATEPPVAHWIAEVEHQLAAEGGL
jgi:hypothetical protein